MKIIVKQAPIEKVVEVNAKIPEFVDPQETYNKEYFENRYQGKENLIIVAYFDGQPAGYIVAYNKYDDGSLYCWMAGVTPKFRRRGILKSLMDYQEKWAKRKGYKKIEIKTRDSRQNMLAYLNKYDFKLIKTIQHPENNRLLFEKNIS